jgi:hypothetical protein
MSVLIFGLVRAKDTFFRYRQDGKGSIVVVLKFCTAPYQIYGQRVDNSNFLEPILVGF